MDKKRKSKKCKVCELGFIPSRPLQNVCSVSCSIKYNSKKEVDKRVKKMKKDSRTLIELRNIARAVFQTWIRGRDAKLPCISSGKTEAKFDAGHYFKAEIYTGLIFEEINCNKQTSYDNDYLAGNLIEYRKGLIKKYGEETVLKLEANADISRQYKFSRQELVDITEFYRNKLKLKDFTPNSKYLNVNQT